MQDGAHCRSLVRGWPQLAPQGASSPVSVQNFLPQLSAPAPEELMMDVIEKPHVQWCIITVPAF
jgi:hypothetical protein